MSKDLYIYGKNSVRDAIDNNRVIKIYTIYNKEYHHYNIPIVITNKTKLDSLVNTNKHQGIVALIKPYETISLKELIKIDKHYPLLVILDGINDPHNLGAILRVVGAIDADGIIYKKHNAIGLNSTVAKVSSGAIEHVKVCEVINISNTIKELKDNGYWIVGSVVDTDVSFTSIDYKVPIALVIGSEGDGISPLVKRNCDHLVKIPMLGKVQSLNASVACGILLYQIYLNRSK